VTLPRDHYSYTVYADPVTASTFDDRRFGGPIGDLIGGEQAATLLAFAGPIEGRRVLDVGTGTGRAALLFARGGAIVTAVDASTEMLAVGRRRAAAEAADVHFLRVDAHALAFADRSVHAAVSLRVLMHAPRWEQCVGELCRVADQLVIVDYPSAHSAARVQSLARRALHAFGVRTEPYRVFSDRQIAEAFALHGFQVRSRHRQFVLPIALHKAFNSRGFTVRCERALGRLGLAERFGSPVTLVAQRCARS
jgi:SAM-dependent methyltransferase